MTLRLAQNRIAHDLPQANTIRHATWAVRLTSVLHDEHGLSTPLAQRCTAASIALILGPGNLPSMHCWDEEPEQLGTAWFQRLPHLQKIFEGIGQRQTRALHQVLRLCVLPRRGFSQRLHGRSCGVLAHLHAASLLSALTDGTQADAACVPPVQHSCSQGVHVHLHAVSCPRTFTISGSSKHARSQVLLPGPWHIKRSTLELH